MGKIDISLNIHPYGLFPPLCPWYINKNEYEKYSSNLNGYIFKLIPKISWNGQPRNTSYMSSITLPNYLPSVYHDPYWSEKYPGWKVGYIFLCKLYNGTVNMIPDLAVNNFKLKLLAYLSQAGRYYNPVSELCVYGRFLSLQNHAIFWPYCFCHITSTLVIWLIYSCGWLPKKQTVLLLVPNFYWC